MASYCNYDYRYFVRKGSFMRRTNKKVMKKADDKKGVILVTVIFIVAMALLFITTALTISIASRQRVYSNAKSDQARLTVTSLAQSIWQAIYSQQINDAMLNNLADGTAGSGSYVLFSNSDVPGMGAGGTESSAYFYRDPADSDKIIVECKCSIEGISQYYRLVLEKNSSEGLPHPMFNMTVELGDAGMLNSVNFGIDASKIYDTDRQHQWQYLTNRAGERITDNVAFIHGSNIDSNRDGSGFYCRVIIEGHAYLRNPVFTDDVYFIGENAVFDWSSTNSADATTTDILPGTTDPRRGNLYFWGTNLPFTGANAGTRMSTFNNIYFDYRDIDSSTSRVQLNRSSNGFNAAGGTRDEAGVGGTFYPRDYANNPPWRIGGAVYYEADYGGTVGTYLADAPSNWHTFDAGTDVVDTNFLNDYLDPNNSNDSAMDTCTEVADPVKGFGTYANHSEARKIDETTTTITAGTWYIEAGTEISNLVTCDVSSGSITVYVEGDITINDKGSGPAGFIISNDAAVDNYCNFVIDSGAITIKTSDDSTGTGFIDTRCIASPYTSYRTINQETFPRFFIFTSYSSSSHASALVLGTGGGGYSKSICCTAFVGFYPSTRNGTDGCSIYLDCASTTLYYGRLACSGIINATSAGGNLNVPYCPNVPGSLEPRDSAYRDNTDYSVVTAECGYFTTNA